MYVIHTRNVHQALYSGLNLLRQCGQQSESRNGPVLVHPTPVTTVYAEPRERVLWWPQRDANPYFHFFECLWMMAGRDDAAYVANFAKNMTNYAEPYTGRMHGAYGWRWMNEADEHQIPMIVELLKSFPQTRRAVLSMWNAEKDLFDKEGPTTPRDIPCNTHIYFWRNDSDELDMTVCCRSNDMIWGAYGANAVHFSFLQEVVASLVGVDVGRYYQMSNNFHAYKNEVWDKCRPIMGEHRDAIVTPYNWMEERVTPYPIVKYAPTWFVELHHFMEPGFIESIENGSVEDVTRIGNSFENPFFMQAAGLLLSHRAYKNGDYAAARKFLRWSSITDWALACNQWLDRREAGLAAGKGRPEANANAQ